MLTTRLMVEDEGSCHPVRWNHVTTSVVLRQEDEGQGDNGRDLEGKAEDLGC